MQGERVEMQMNPMRAAAAAKAIATATTKVVVQPQPISQPSSTALPSDALVAPVDELSSPGVRNHCVHVENVAVLDKTIRLLN